MRGVCVRVRVSELQVAEQFCTAHDLKHPQRLTTALTFEALDVACRLLRGHGALQHVRQHLLHAVYRVSCEAVSCCSVLLLRVCVHVRV